MCCISRSIDSCLPQCHNKCLILFCAFITWNILCHQISPQRCEYATCRDQNLWSLTSSHLPPKEKLAPLQTWYTHFLCQNLWSVLKNLQASCNMTKSSYYRISPISKENFPFFDSEKVGRFNHCMDQNDWENLLKSSNSSLSALKFLLPLTDWPLMLKEGRIFLSPWVCNFCVLSLAVKDLILGTNGF